MNKTSIVTSVLSLALFCPSAYAGKPERDMIDELTPKVTESKDLIKSSCGCDSEVKVNWDSYPDVKVMYSVSGALGSVQTAVKSFCEKDADKKAFCANVSAIEVAHGSEATATYTPKKIAVNTTEAYPSDSVITEILSKF